MVSPANTGLLYRVIGQTFVEPLLSCFGPPFASCLQQPSEALIFVVLCRLCRFDERSAKHASPLSNAVIFPQADPRTFPPQPRITMFRPSQIPSAIAATLAILLGCQVSLAQLPSIRGTVTHGGSVLDGVELTLYEDDGDMTFDIGLDSVIVTMSSDADGGYLFSGLDASTNYFVYQSDQSVGTLEIHSSVSGPIDPIVELLLVDGFEHQQRVEASPVAMTDALNFSAGSILGGQRDLRVDYHSGPAEIVLHANPWG